MNAGTLALAALGLPFCSFLLLAVVPPLRRAGRAAGALSIAAIGGSLLASLVLWCWPPFEKARVITRVACGRDKQDTRVLWGTLPC